ncbi:MAG TPA: chaperone modulator CbpM [Hypericibacter adhaerens]|jgi:chaperone modulatory protein CbpM|uniref:chaperone modulator CbpM n=1 Tax=Hypericibacter adhaerens TaxID=2602016 RepID=UPI002CDF58EC|nr:chaperone modulator CbpM [Hypericibacter adhaerens]HWA44598.1 chaperone modulator CbpM [Hypericibacter adhaerens]
MTRWTLEQVVAEIGVDRAAVTSWVEQHWVLPESEGGAWHFDDLDLARLRLIAELTQELEIGDEAIPVVLNLLDQIYQLRDKLAALEQAIEQASPDCRAEIAQILGGGKTEE